MSRQPRILPRALLAAALLAASLGAAPLAAQRAGARVERAERAERAYFPPPGDAWERRAPRAVGMDSARLAEAVAFAIANEAKAPRDLELAHYLGVGREPFGEAVGPFKPRGDPTGVVVRRGYIVAEWGEPERVDMTFSVTKSFLSTAVGLAFDRGMLRLEDPVWRAMGPVVMAAPERGDRSAEALARRGEVLAPFDTPHNRRVTWEHLLRQTSDWEGTLWGKPEWADRPTGAPEEWRTRARHDPGAVYEYNDVRVNVLALAALNVWRRPLPEVVRELVMDPIGASPTWRWYGYDNSWVLIDGRAVQSVSGGGHWGGGMFISARDQARFGYLTLRRGRWGDRQLLSEAWVRRALTPTTADPGYGFMNWFLNTDRKRFPSAPAAAFAHLGNGTNMVFVDPEHDLVVVARWIENAALDGLVRRVLAAVDGAATATAERR
ncbi:MAG TPA: serine hydrolase [Gemmatimonadaceae bacterium]|nr:serine hydrolase [Gemmatimonadaceae bacterium]